MHSKELDLRLVCIITEQSKSEDEQNRHGHIFAFCSMHSFFSCS